MRNQYATQFLLPKLAKRCDDIAEENYVIPNTSDYRQLRGNASSTLGEDGLYAFAEEDFADAREVVTYDASHFMLRGDIDADDVVVLQNINSIIERVLQKRPVTNSELKSVLTPTQYEEFEGLLTEIRHAEEINYADGMPEELKSYVQILKQADFVFGNAERMAGRAERGWKYKRETITRAYNRAESLYERALEDLEETFGCASDADELHKLTVWLDREIDFSTNGNLSIDQDGVPRVRGSKSAFAQDAGLPKLSAKLKREESVLMALLVAACEIAFVLPTQNNASEVSADDTKKLKSLLAKLCH
ncbi:hypothetical protein [Flavobacterium sp.]|uniref:hypothetical protein n=1 Tax=Flavobacterium sp. TaxID=239 RepID=UPI0037C08EFC